MSIEFNGIKLKVGNVVCLKGRGDLKFKVVDVDTLGYYIKVCLPRGKWFEVDVNDIVTVYEYLDTRKPILNEVKPKTDMEKFKDLSIEVLSKIEPLPLFLLLLLTLAGGGLFAILLILFTKDWK